jgi:adenylate cyclase class IV
MKNIEVEFRFQAGDKEKARDFLNKLEFLGKSVQKDVYFDTKTGDMYKRGIFIRTRNGKSLDFKFNLEDVENRHEDCNEHSFLLPLTGNDSENLNSVCEILGLEKPPATSLEEFVHANGLEEFVVIDKVREKFRDGDFVFTLDNVKGFGMFIEIEAMTTEGSDLESLKKRMIERVKGLNPKFIPTGYIEYFVKEKDFDLYKQGRYLFDEDKEDK